MREIKFRAWDAIVGRMVPASMLGYFVEFDGEVWKNAGNGQEDWLVAETVELMQFTGLKDKNGTQEVYECDIIDAEGVVIGNYYENSTLLSGPTNLIVTGFCTENWRNTEEEALKRGCRYAQ